MQVLEDVPEITTARPAFEILTYDTRLIEINMKASYPEYEGIKFHTILDTTVSLLP